MSTYQSSRSVEQMEIVRQLTEQFGLRPEAIHFYKPDKLEPWLSAESLTAIARQSAKLQSISESYDQFIEQLNQVVHSATVVDADGHPFTRSGVAQVGELLADTDEVMDEHRLAASRALHSALSTAGFNPLKPAPVAPIELNATAVKFGGDGPPEKTLKYIHALATERGLIVENKGAPRNSRRYREFIEKNFGGRRSSTALTDIEILSLINLLRQLPIAGSEEIDEFEGIC